ncbi:MAG TPA: glycosyl hydrolase-related protein, partial [Clostridia bacterium]|nr:glycosyl hydrolase-related protein [Clostridia bacterium]
LRVYECFNRRTDCTIDLNFEVVKAIECDLMENDICDAVIENSVLKFTIKPYEIKTFKIS